MCKYRAAIISCVSIMPRTRSRCWEARLNQATPFLVDPTGKKLHLKPNTDDEEVRKLTQVQRVPKVKVVRTQGQFGLETTVEVADGTYLCAFGGMVVPSNSDLGSSTCNAVELQTVNQRRGKKAVDPSRFGNEARFANHSRGEATARLHGLPFTETNGDECLVPVLVANRKLPAGTSVRFDYCSSQKQAEALEKRWLQGKWEKKTSQFYCAECSMNFESRHAITEHSHRCQSFGCSECAQRFSSAAHAARHERVHHLRTPSPQKRKSKKRPPELSIQPASTRGDLRRRAPNPFKSASGPETQSSAVPPVSSLRDQRPRRSCADQADSRRMPAPTKLTVGGCLPQKKTNQRGSFAVDVRRHLRVWTTCNDTHEELTTNVPSPLIINELKIPLLINAILTN